MAQMNIQDNHINTPPAAYQPQQQQQQSNYPYQTSQQAAPAPAPALVYPGSTYQPSSYQSYHPSGAPQQQQQLPPPPPPTIHGQQHQQQQPPPPSSMQPLYNLSGVSTVANQPAPGFYQPMPPHLSGSAVGPAMNMPNVSDGLHPQQGGQGAKLDSSKIPSPAAYRYPQVYYKHVYKTSAMDQTTVPVAGTRYIVHDEGTCSPRFIRPTLHKLPLDDGLLKSSGLVMGALINPLAELGPEDVPCPIPVVNFTELASASQQQQHYMQQPQQQQQVFGGVPFSAMVGGGNDMLSGMMPPAQQQQPKQQDNDDSLVPDENTGGPIRCHRCRVYINPFVKFLNGGKNFICNFCGFQNEVPKWYMCPLDAYGMRRDVEQRPELKYGSVDFVASKHYISREPAPLTYVFVIDVSTNAHAQGIPQAIIHPMRSILQRIRDTHEKSKIAFITYGRTVHFYNMKPTGGHPQVMVVGNVDEVFVPLTDSGLPTVGEIVDNDCAFLQKLVVLAAGIKESDNAMGSAVEAASQLLERTGGRVLLFSSHLPNVGKGAVTPRADYKLYGTPNEKVLFNAVSNAPYWRSDADRLAKLQVCIDTFLFPSSFMESATLSTISSVTNGHLYVYQSFSQQRDGPRLYNDMYRCLTRNTGYDALLKIRCSTGISVKRYYGHYLSQTVDDMDLAGVDADTSFAVDFKHDTKLDENLHTYVQAALLYTSREGRRMIRVHTARLGTATTVGTVFRHADLDATMGLMAKQVMHQIIRNQDPFVMIRQQLTMRCVDILHCYRKQCSANSSPGQLILPESLKLLPVYLVGLKKSPALREGTDITVDERYAAMYAIVNMGGEHILQYCYPQLFALHDMEPPVRDPSDNSLLPLPRRLPLTASRVEAHGIYLLEDSINTYIWVGRSAAPEHIQAIFGVQSVDEIGVQAVPRPDLSTELGRRFADITEELRKGRYRNGPFRVFKDQDASENQFFMRLIEDRVGNAPSYVEELCTVHKDIQQRG